MPPSDTADVVILFLDVVGFSMGGCDEQRELIEQLHERIDSRLQREGIPRVLGRLPTGDGVVLLIDASTHAAYSKVTKIAHQLRQDGIPLRMGLHCGSVVRTTLGITGSHNFCGDAINMAQRIMDLAHGNAIACSTEYHGAAVRAGVHDGHFGQEFHAQVKHGKPVKVRFYYGKPPPADEDGEVEGGLAVYKWKKVKLSERGLDFYVWAFEHPGGPGERLHKSLVGKNFARPDRQPFVPTHIVDVARFGRLALDAYPAKYVESIRHPDPSVCGPRLNDGDLCAGLFEARYYLSVLGPLGRNRIVLEARYGRALNHAAEEGFPQTRVGESSVSLSGSDDHAIAAAQAETGWLEQSIFFNYVNQPFVELRTMFYLSEPMPELWFYKLHLRHLADADLDPVTLVHGDTF
jgi:hypothetical protein